MVSGLNILNILRYFLYQRNYLQGILHIFYL